MEQKLEKDFCGKILTNIQPVTLHVQYAVDDGAMQ